MKFSENAINILVTKSYKGIGRAWVNKNLCGNEDIENIVFLLNQSTNDCIKTSVEEFKERKLLFKDKLIELEGFVDGLVALGDSNFPQHRGIVKNSEKPIYLFFKGDISLLNLKNKNIAVIGLLNPDSDTEIVEQQIVTELIKNKATIVSGLAIGCDTIAHKQAINSDGKTIAVLPGPLNEIIPAVNNELAKEIVDKNGLLVTEYFDIAKSKIELSGRYQERDRLQALFSDVVILSASYAKNSNGKDSGSRLAMEYAFNYSIPRAVIYNPSINKDNQKYDLCRQIISNDINTIVINTNNLDTSIEEVMSIDSKSVYKKSLQLDLF